MSTPTSKHPGRPAAAAHPEPPALGAEKEGRVSVWGALRATPGSRACIPVGWAFRGHRKRCSQPLWQSQMLVASHPSSPAAQFRLTLNLPGPVPFSAGWGIQVSEEEAPASLAAGAIGPSAGKGQRLL